MIRYKLDSKKQYFGHEILKEEHSKVILYCKQTNKIYMFIDNKICEYDNKNDLKYSNIKFNEFLDSKFQYIVELYHAEMRIKKG